MYRSTSAVARLVNFRRSALAQSISQHLTLPRLFALVAITVSVPAFAQSFPASIDLSQLDGNDGFVINGVDFDDKSGTSVSAAGDVNADGVDDLIIGAPDADPNATARLGQSGESHVVFGGSNIGAGGLIELSDLDGTNGFVINGINVAHMSGSSVSGAGDINGDGVDDLIIGAPGVGPTDEITFQGASYVVFGSNGVGAGGVIELSDLDGSNGFVVNGIDEVDTSGGSVSGVGDINGDGVDDLVIGASRADPNGNNSGEAYVVFGGGDIGVNGVIDLSGLDGNNGFVLNGISAEDFFGQSVSAAGDVNGDGVIDLIFGASGGDNNGSDSGESYVVFGGSDVGSSGVVELSNLDGSDGFVLNGIDEEDFSGASVSGAGDFNGDGVDDLIIGAPGANPNGDFTGETYVVYGRSGIGNGGVIELSSLDGTNGFALNGIDFSSENIFTDTTVVARTSVSGAGDINNDGLDDLIIGAAQADDLGYFDDQIYVVFGSSDFAAVFELSDIDGNNGFVLNGLNQGRYSAGLDVSRAGDINNDGVDDLIIGARNDRVFGNSGASFVVFGKTTTPSPVLTCNGLTVTVNLALGQNPTNGDDVIIGTEGADRIRALGGNDTICGLGGHDIINAGSGDDWVDAGAGSDVVYGLSGADVLRGRSGADRINGGSGEDLINGDGGSDFLNGGLGDDLVYGGGGKDGVFGSAGRDILFGGNGNDSIFGGSGADRINGGAGADALNGGNGNDSCVADNSDSVTGCE